MTGSIFLNYRRGDDAGTVGRLFDRLEQVFTKDRLFMDVEGHIKAGDDYVDTLRAQVASCDVLLAVIGPRWLTIPDETGRRRLDNPDDWVRIEIASALDAGVRKRVIPVLVGGADMPRAEDLPDDLKPLARKQAVRITLERFKSDAQGLVDQISSVLTALEPHEPPQTSPNETPPKRRFCNANPLSPLAPSRLRNAPANSASRVSRATKSAKARNSPTGNSPSPATTWTSCATISPASLTA